jgi:hypothetical protein
MKDRATNMEVSQNLSEWVGPADLRQPAGRSQEDFPTPYPSALSM